MKAFTLEHWKLTVAGGWAAAQTRGLGVTLDTMLLLGVGTIVGGTVGGLAGGPRWGYFGSAQAVAEQTGGCMRQTPGNRLTRKGGLAREAGRLAELALDSQ